jgi:flagellar biosynthesis/type III secretory pathway protein FliH
MRSFLERFRPAGAPGAAAAAVPADRRVELAAELEPVFAMLTEAENGRRLLLERAEQEARQIRAGGRAQAAALVSKARTGAETERTTAAARIQEAGAARDAGLINDARKEAAAIRRRAATRLPDLAAEAVGSVRGLATEQERGADA